MSPKETPFNAQVNMAFERENQMEGVGERIRIPNFGGWGVIF